MVFWGAEVVPKKPHSMEQFLGTVRVSMVRYSKLTVTVCLLSQPRCPKELADECSFRVWWEERQRRAKVLRLVIRPF